MMSTRLFRGRLCASAACIGIMAAFAPADCYAQDTPPPARFVLDENGVNLATGRRTQREVEVSIGAGRAALTSYVTRKGTGLTKSDFDLNVYQSGVRLSFAILGPSGQESEAFAQNGNTFTSVEGDGSTVTLSGSTYTLTLADGTKYLYSTNLTTPDSARLARATSIVQPNGDTYTMNWLITSKCVNQYQSGCSGGNFNSFSNKIVRLSSITSAYGYGLGYTYQSNTVTSSAWGMLAKVTAYNALVDSCTPYGCSFTQAWPNVSYSQSQSGGTATLAATDALNQTTTYSTSAGREAVQLPGSGSDDLVVNTDPYGAVTSITKAGKTWQYAFSFSAPNRSVTITNPDGTTRQVTSDTNVGLPVTVKDEDGNTTTYQYDGSGRLALTIAPDGHQTKLTYNDRGDVTETRIISATPGTPPDLVSTATFDPSCANAVTCNQPSATFDANQRETDYSYDPTFGALTKVTYPADANGLHPETRYAYTGQAAPAGGTVYLLTTTSSCRTQASCAGGADETKTTITYGAAAGKNNLLAIAATTAAGDGSLSSTANLQYDLVGNLTGLDGPLAGSADTANVSYDAMRRRTAVIGPDPDGSGPMNRRAQVYHYLPNGLVDSVSIGTTDAAGGNFNSLQQMVTSYDTNLRKVKTTTSAGGTTFAVTQYGYDGMNRVQCVATRMDPAQWGSQGDACAPQTNGPNGADRITYTHYEPAGRPDYVITGYGTSVAATEASVRYTALGLPQTVKDANSNTTTYGYDGFGRQTTTTYTDGSYEALTLDPIGNPTSRLLRDGQVINYGYDALGRMTTKDVPNQVIHEYDIAYQYDLAGRLTRATDSNTHFTALSYDALGRQTSEQSNWTTRTWGYDAAGRRTSLNWGDGFYVTYDYDAADEVTAIRENGGFVLASFGYDDLGRRTSLTRGNGTSTSYGYDGASRLTALSLNGGNQPNGYTFGYNPAGQITSRTASNDAYTWTGAVNVDRTYAVNGLNQYTSAGATVFGYDGRGNLTASGSTAYGYTSENRLATAPGTVMTYDPLGRYHWVTNGNPITWMQYDGGSAITELAGNAQVQRRYVFGPGGDEPLVWYEGSGTGDRRYLHADERGSIVEVTNDAGTAIAVNTYDEFGIPGAGNIGRFQYTGQKWIPELGMFDYKARMYSPTLGRFLQTDPIGYGDGMNWYNYLGGDPVNFTDPSGLSCKVNGIETGLSEGDCTKAGGQYVANQVASDDSGGGGSVGPDIVVTAFRMPSGPPISDAGITIIGTIVDRIIGIPALILDSKATNDPAVLTVKLPANPDQLKHIFRSKENHAENFDLAKDAIKATLARGDVSRNASRQTTTYRYAISPNLEAILTIYDPTAVIGNFYYTNK